MYPYNRMKYHIGCSGWSYDGWMGTFYPQELENQYWLSYYSQIFSFVEIDSTFYKIPSKFMVSNWNKRTQRFQIYCEISSNLNT